MVGADNVAGKRRVPRVSLREAELRTLLLVGDALAIILGSWFAPAVWAIFDRAYVATESVPYWQISSALVWLLLLRIVGEDFGRRRFLRYSLSSVGQVAITLTAVVLGLFYLEPFFAPRGSTLISLPVVAVSVIVWRVMFATLVGTQLFQRSIAIVGTDEGAIRTARALLESAGSTYRLRAYLTESDASDRILGIPVVAVRDDLWELVRRLGIEQLVIGHTQSLSPRISNELVRCFDHGVEAVPATVLYEEITGRVLVSALEADWYAGLPTKRGPYMAVKRFVDVALSLSLLLVLAPVIALLAGIVLIASGRPVLLRQIRVGERGRPFVIHKLRTMHPDAESAGQPIWAIPNDPRVTRVGRFLRASRLDELPQLWDVLRGAMSLIGPRPERPEFSDRLAAELPLYRARTLVRPGITGWAQVRYRYAGSVADNLTKLEYDLYYVRHAGPMLDAIIAFRTVGVVLRHRGS
jgi:exopolysaccharide biosynthesis polyprenyl glycosylphosphotransferase